MKEASVHSDQKSELIKKYKNWSQVPLIMSPSAAVSAFRSL
jgi:hypothetical protein